MQPLQQQAQQQGGQHSLPQPPTPTNSQQPVYAPPPLPPPPPSGQDWTLSSVLHYLQSDWRKYERDRNEWEIERAEMRARIALLEGERRSFENVKLDFMRRIKMLEYALRIERCEFELRLVSCSNNRAFFLSSKQLTTQPPGSGGSSRIHVEGALSKEEAGPEHKSGSGRDPKSRARSREYLKQCLQEITYLTSPQAVNPLPNRPLLNVAGSSSAPNLVSIPNLPTFSVDFPPQSTQQFSNQPSALTSQSQGTHQSLQGASQPQVHFQNPQTPGTIQLAAVNGRPRKVVPDMGRDSLVSNTTVDAPSDAVRSVRTIAITPDIPADISPHGERERGEDENEENNADMVEHSEARLASPPQLSLLHPEPHSDTNGLIEISSSHAISEGSETSREPSQLTAIFRPDDAGHWREQFRAAHANADESQNDPGTWRLHLCIRLGSIPSIFRP
jgi:striatin 1/3/4